MSADHYRRAWINQPSGLQGLHRLHGVRVLVGPEDPRRPGVVTVWFTEGDVVSMEVSTTSLSPGWPDKKPA